MALNFSFNLIGELSDYCHIRHYYMKAYIAKLMLLAPVVLSFATQAATPTADLKVKGKLGVPTCTVIAPDNGVYDLGKISATNIKSGTTTTALPTVTKTWVTTCDTETYLTYTVQDNRSGSESATGGGNYGLGFVNGTGKIGYYTFLMTNPKVDNVSANIRCDGPPESGAEPNCTTTSRMYKNYTQGWSNADNSLKAGKTFSIDIAVHTVLAGAATMNGPVTEDTQIDGSTTINFAFAI